MQHDKWLRRACAGVAGAVFAVGVATVAPFPATGASATAKAAKEDAGPTAKEPQRPNHHGGRGEGAEPADRGALSAPPRAAMSAIAQTYTVDTTDDDPAVDSASTACVTAESECSLRAAVQAANADRMTVDRIVVPAMTITLANGQLEEINSHIIIDGAGAASTVIDANGSSRAFYVSAGNLTLNDVTVQNGVGEGGALYVDDGAITLDGVTAADNDANGGDGGALYVDYDSSAWVGNSTFTANAADEGGAIYVEGVMNLTNSVVGGATDAEGNTERYGGGIDSYYDANVTMTNTTVRNNTASGSCAEAGGVYNDGRFTMTGGAISDNAAISSSSSGWAGGLTNYGVAHLADAEVARNSVTGTGGAGAGGIYNDWQLQLVNVKVDGNTLNATADDAWLEGGGIDNAYNVSMVGGSVSGNNASAIGDQTFGDGVTAQDSTTFESDAANFTSADVGERITGAGIPANTTISGWTDENTVTLSQPASATATGLTFTIHDRLNADVYGAGIATYYSADIDGVTFANNVADSGGSDEDSTSDDDVEGGALVNWDNAAIRNSTFTGTTAKGDEVYGGAVLLDDNSAVANLAVSDTTVVADDYAEGGAVLNWYDATFTGLEIARTSVTLGPDGSVYGGALYHYATSPATFNDTSVANTTVSIPADGYVWGGAVAFDYEVNAKNFSVTDTQVTAGDEGDVEGGGLMTYYGGSFTDFRVERNAVTVGENGGVEGAGWYSDDWSVLNRGSVSGNTATGGDDLDGAGMYAYYGVNANRVTFANNAATTTEAGADLEGGGLYIDDRSQMTNVTISGNTVNASGSGSEAEGGGLYTDYPLTLTHVTLANNAASGTTDDVETTETDEASTADAGAAIYASDNVTVRSSIVSGNAPETSQCATGLSESARIHSAGWNIDSGESCNFDGAGDLENTDPMVGPLQDNGGPGLTHALLAGSAAIDAAASASCPPTDERGQSRPVGDGCDVGAYEYVAVANTPPPTDGGDRDGGTPSAAGYWLAGSDGGVFNFGGASFHGSAGNIRLNQPIVSMAATPSGNGYWLVASDGGVFTYGDAGYFGSTGAIKLNKPIVGMVATPSGGGYWLVASDGGIFAFGDAPFFGSTGAMTLNAPIVNMGVRPNGDGYWLVATDGGVFTFGSALFHGSTGAVKLNKPIVDIIPTDDGDGYWLIASDGGLFTFGDAAFLGSQGGSPLNRPVVDGARSADGEGYYMAASDGGVFTFGDAGYYGSTGAMTLNQPIVAMSVKR